MTFPTEQEARKHLEWMQAEMKAQGVEEPHKDSVVIQTTHGYWVAIPSEWAKRTPDTCIICGGLFYEYPNNPQPVAEGGCCAYCDEHVVWPARSRAASKKRASRSRVWSAGAYRGKSARWFVRSDEDGITIDFECEGDEHLETTSMTISLDPEQARQLSQDILAKAILAKADASQKQLS